MIINHIMFDRVFKKWYMEISKGAGTSEVEISSDVAEQLIKDLLTENALILAITC